jgi:hypothetical protein
VSAPDAIGQSVPGPRRTTSFRRRPKSPPQSPDQSRRQSDLVQSAWRHFGEAAPMIAFLNTRHEALKAQPLHLALESDEGLARVETLLRQMTFDAQLETRS